MRADEFDYQLPRERIAQRPPPMRGDSRLMVLDRQARSWVHARFASLRDFLRPGDLLVRNDTKVIRARLRGERQGGGEVEVLLLRPDGAQAGGEVWTCLARPGRRLRPGRTVELRGGMSGEWIDDGSGDGVRRIRLRAERPVLEVLERHGEVPLPPYIERPPTDEDAAAYQTVYARAPGAVAAPTAGLHFTDEMLAEIARIGIEIVSLTLHVGVATFLPLREEVVEGQRIPGEAVEIPADTAAAVERAKHEGRRVIAVGTTTVRALEGMLKDLEPAARSGEVTLFIAPGFRFRIVDALITNFHLPRSTLLMLVAAFAGKEFILSAYREAIEESYRFYSYGDAMLIR